MFGVILEWHQLAVVTSYPNPVLRNRNVYPNVIQSGPINAETVIAVIHGFIRKFNWNTIYLVGDAEGTARAIATTGVALMENRLRKTPGTVVYSAVVDSSTGTPFGKVLNDIKKVARSMYSTEIPYQWRYEEWPQIRSTPFLPHNVHAPTLLDDWLTWRCLRFSYSLQGSR